MSNTDAGQIHRGNLNKLISKIDTERGIDMGQFRRQYLERRIASRLRNLGLHSYRQYAEFLDAHPEEYTALLDALTINVTEFFRDPQVFDLFRRQIVPQMIEEKTASHQRIIRAWSAGCATGQETYSMTMALMDGIERTGNPFLLSVLGTDLDEHALEVGRLARYDIQEVKHIPASYQSKYVDRRHEHFTVRPEVTRHVKFRPLNLFNDEPLQVVDVIFCRNVFIYFGRDQQEHILDKFWSALARGGYLVLGRSEKLSRSAADRLELVNGRERIYRKPTGH